ncbi:DUF4124 domain-containing protein [Frateuria sp. STR12]|uniref:DUF4124 domain-containing protein n=1 Tax=Frateuria hangzhouensis TaxID=2995589 RepID=UPI002260E85D|nr:DUF4124 domain-containing protein [Frateuria sp. STR12]MCX7514766.1 DUF4124 domain-containing protein [Frateuria sp. STR12]
MLGALSMVRGKLVIACMAACLCMTASAQDGSYYKWTDANGTVHFSATPPPGHKAEALRMDGQAAAQAAPAPPLPPAQPTDALEKAQDAYRERSCEAARSDLQLLQQDRMVVSGDSPDAATKLDAEQRNQAKLRAKQRVSQFCKAGDKP